MSAVAYHSAPIDTFLATPLEMLVEAAKQVRSAQYGPLISYSRKIFLPVTHLCRDTCRYCTFARAPKPGQSVFMSEEDVLSTARRGAAMGCREALFTLGDQPEARWPQARAALDQMGFTSTLDYVAHLASRVLTETGLLPHLNPGIMDEARLRQFRAVAPSMGLMLESTSPRLMARGGPHHGCPDKEPQTRLAVIEAAGRARVPFTTGLLIGIGETRAERLEALLALRDLSERFGHIQEVIIQPFRAKPSTPMRAAPEPSDDDLLWTVASARLILDPTIAIQTPPNLSPAALASLIEAGVSDFGGISPLTPDFVNPEAPWPHIGALASQLAERGYSLVERLTLYPSFAANAERWVDDALAPKIRTAVDAGGWPREDDWLSGQTQKAPARINAPTPLRDARVSAALDRVLTADRATPEDIAILFSAREASFEDVCAAADAARKRQVGDTVSYVVTRNINYTNVCTYRCGFCAFSKGRVAPELRSAPYLVDETEIQRRTAEAWARGATEACLQGGIHPEFDGHTYLAILAAAKAGAKALHLHAFSPLELMHGAHSLGMPLKDYLRMLKQAGLGSVPGTAAEILHDDARARLCPDKLSADEWIDVMSVVHETGLKSTATIMFGHVDTYDQWATHLLRVRDLAAQTGGFTEFVPLPFVADEAPIYKHGKSRRGPTFREAVLMHAVARLTLGAHVSNIQTSWVKMGPEGAQRCLQAGANDLGGTLMNETITRSAGARHGQEMTPLALEALAEAIGRPTRQRTTLYADAPSERRMAARAAADLSPTIASPAVRRQRSATRTQA